MNERGLSLVEVIVTLGILGGATLVVLNLTQQSTKSSSKFQYDTEVNLIKNEIVGILSDPDRCLKTLTNANPPSPPTSNKNPIDNVQGKFYISSHSSAPKNGYGNGNVKITDLSLITNSLPPNEGKLLIGFENKNILKGSSGPSIVNKEVNLYIEKNAGGLITKCRSLSSASADIWTRGSGSHIYYDGGNVGINTSTPTSALTVAGNITASGGGMMYANNFQYTSDKKLKKNVIKIEHALEKTLSLRGVYFDWIENDTPDVGFIAQEVQQSIPEIVKYDQGRDVKTVDYAKVVPFLVEALKTQQLQIELMKKEITELKKVFNK